METRFQTSFIPKKTPGPAGGLAGAPAARRARSTIFMTFSVIVFIGSIAGAGGSYAWKYYLISAQESFKQQLAQRQQQFNVDLIEQLKQVNIKINTAKSLISNHIAASQVFDVVSRLTIEKVRFLDMDLSSGSVTGNNQQSAGLTLRMRGKGTSFSTVAFQSDVLGQLEQYGLRKSVKNPILADPTLNEDGSVSFSFSATIDPKSISYEKSVITAPDQPANQGTAPTQ